MLQHPAQMGKFRFFFRVLLKLVIFAACLAGAAPAEEISRSRLSILSLRLLGY
jgi:hypothetical protein